MYQLKDKNGNNIYPITSTDCLIQGNRPPQQFIDKWNRYCLGYGKYNEETGYFELNGFTDISYKEAQIIDEQSFPLFAWGTTHANSTVRTFYPLRSSGGAYGSTTQNYEFAKCYNLKVIRFYDDYNQVKGGSFYRSPELRQILGGYLAIRDEVLFFESCTELELVEKWNITKSFSIKNCGKLNLQTFQAIVKGAQATTAITITVHPDIYAKLTDESNEDWYKVNQDAIAKNVLFAV